MTLRHEIETNLDTINDTRDFLQIILNRIAAMHAGSKITVNDDVSFLRVIIQGNGAVLRDVVTALDQAGYLD